MAIVCLSFTHGFTALTAAIANPSAVIEGIIRGNFPLHIGVMRLASEVIASVLTFQVVKVFWTYSSSPDHSFSLRQTSPCAIKYRVKRIK